MSVDGKIAVVTGAGGGLGKQHALLLAEHGAKVVVNDLGGNLDGSGSGDAADMVVEEIRSLGGEAIANKNSVSDRDGAKNIIGAAVNEWGTVDIVVNNAGISGPNVTSWEYPIESWQEVIDINLTGTFLISRAVIPFMLETGYGRIVNISSVAGKDGNPKAPAYSASKAGVIALTKALGKELAENNIMVNCVTPAAVNTPIFEQMTQEHIDYMLSKIPMKRFGTTSEVAALVAWLCSEECSFSTGGVFDLSGGRSTY